MELAESLLDRGADVDAEDYGCAARFMKRRIGGGGKLRLLLNRGADAASADAG